MGDENGIVETIPEAVTGSANAVAADLKAIAEGVTDVVAVSGKENEQGREMLVEHSRIAKGQAGMLATTSR